MAGFRRSPHLKKRPIDTSPKLEEAVPQTEKEPDIELPTLLRQVQHHPHLLTSHQILSLQATIGNKAVMRALQKSTRPPAKTATVNPTVIQRVWEKKEINDEDPFFWDLDKGYLYDASSNKFYKIKIEENKIVAQVEITTEEARQNIWNDPHYVALKKPIQTVKSLLSKQQKKQVNKWIAFQKEKDHPYYYKHETEKIVFDAVGECFFVGDRKVDNPEEKEFKLLQSLFDKRTAPEISKTDAMEISRLKEERKGKIKIEQLNFEDLPIETQFLVIGPAMEELQKIIEKQIQNKPLDEKDILILNKVKSQLDLIRKDYENEENKAKAINYLCLMANKAAGEELKEGALHKGLALLYSAISFITSLEHYSQRASSEEDRARQKSETRKKAVETAKEKDTKQKFGFNESSLTLKYSMEDHEAGSKKKWWEAKYEDEALMLVKKCKSVTLIGNVLGQKPNEIAIQSIKICGSVNRALGYLRRLDATLKYWPRLDNLDIHLKNLFSQTSYTAFHGAVPEIEIACREIALGRVASGTKVKIGHKEAKPGSSSEKEFIKDSKTEIGSPKENNNNSTQELDVFFQGKEHKNEIREVKADVNALVKKYGKSAKTTTSKEEGASTEIEKPAQLVSYNLFAEQPDTQVIIYCQNTNGWMNIFNRGAAQNIVLFPKLTLVIGSLVLDNEKLKFLIDIIEEYKEALGKNWQEWEWSHDWRTPQAFLDWYSEAPKPKQYKETWQGVAVKRPRSNSAPPKLSTKK